MDNKLKHKKDCPKNFPHLEGGRCGSKYCIPCSSPCTCKPEPQYESKKEPNIKCERCLNMLNPSAFIGEDKICIGCRRTEEAEPHEHKKEDIRKIISKILVKWNMPTRQAAISEIVALFARQPKEPEPQDWEARLQFEIMEDYLRDAEWMLDKKDGKKQEVMRKHWEKLKSFIRQTLKEKSQEIEERIKRIKIGTSEIHGTHKYDSCYDEALKIIKEILK